MHRLPLVALAVPLVLSGCSSHAARTSSRSAAPSPPPTSAPPSAAPTATPVPVVPTATPTLVATTACATSRLRLAVSEAGAAAGTAYWALDLQNAGGTPCTLTGYPGVSFTDPAGRQLGLPAERSAGQALTRVVLAPGGYAHAALGIPTAANFQTGPGPSSNPCHPADTALVRLYPPGQRQALTAALRTTICTTSDGRTSVTSVSAGRLTLPAG